jgi:hypothetical protein
VEDLTASNRSNVGLRKSKHRYGSTFCGNELYFKTGVVTVTMHDGSHVASPEVVARNVVQQNHGF